MHILITILEFLGVLAVVVMVHEFGHFATAKAFGIRVNEFGFGFPPRLLGLRRGETFYTLNLLPLGGFVKLEGENDPTVPRSLASKGVGTRFLVLVAGPFMNVVLAVVLLSGLFMFTVGEIRVADVSPGSPADLVRLLPGDTIIDVNGNRVKSFEDLVNEVHPNRGAEVEWRIRRGDNRLTFSLVPQINPLSEELATGISVDTMGERRVQNVASGSPAGSAGVLPGDVILQINGNPVDSLHKLTSAINSNRGNEVEWLVRRGSTEQVFRLVPRLDPVPGQGATGITVDIEGDIQVKQVAPGSPAALAGVVPGDTIVVVGGNPVRGFPDLVASVNRNRGEETEWVVRRGDLERTLRLAPRESTLLKEVSTGITVDYVGLQGRPVHPPWEALAMGFKGTGTVMVAMKREVSGWISEGNATGIAGPIGIAQVTGEVVREAGLVSLVLLAALISISLAIFNILPIPALDGGRLVFVILEWVRRGKRIPPEKEGMVHMVGFAVLMAAVVVIGYNDIMRIVEGRSLLP